MTAVGHNWRESVMPLLDVYGRTQELDAKSIDTIATRLEARRGSAKYMGMLQEYLEAIDLAAAQSVLVLGCGTGVEVREVVRRPDFRGRVTAIDISADLVERGKSLAEQKGFSGSIEWLVGDAQELRLSDGVFDLVLAHTLVSHVPDPKRVVQEAARVVRPGGTVVIFDGDYTTLTFGVDREMDEKIISGNIANPRIMRAMSQLLCEVGLKLVDSRGWMLTEIGRADFFLGSLQSYPVLLPKAGVATPEEVQAFVGRQLRASEDGTFFAGYNFYAMIAERPSQ
jgi:ubiquinone/menaquinone biosynthesis C-methylase UbiE